MTVVVALGGALGAGGGAADGCRGWVARVEPTSGPVGHVVLPQGPLAEDAPTLAALLRAAGPADSARSHALAHDLIGAARAAGVPTALVVGVLMVENPALDSHMRRPDGAHGLLGVRVAWGRRYAEQFGPNLGVDHTNLLVGARMLADFTGRERDWRTALQRYHGCAVDHRGHPSPPAGAARDAGDCATYPERVRTVVDRHSAVLCGPLTFDECVVASLAGTYLDEHDP